MTQNITTPADFIVAARAAGLDAWEGEMDPAGALPDGRGWICSPADDGDRGAPWPPLVLVHVYEPDPQDGYGVDLNSPVASLLDCTPGQALAALRIAAVGDWSAFTPMDGFQAVPARPGPLPLEWTQAPHGTPLFSSETRAYLREALRKDLRRCPSCSFVADADGVVTTFHGTHVVAGGIIVLGCGLTRVLSLARPGGPAPRRGQHHPGPGAEPTAPRELSIRLHSGGFICTDTAAASPAGSTYVRVCDWGGNEIAYWDKAEWEQSPQEVMGAILGAARPPPRRTAHSPASSETSGVTPHGSCPH